MVKRGIKVPFTIIVLERDHREDIHSRLIYYELLFWIDSFNISNLSAHMFLFNYTNISKEWFTKNVSKLGYDWQR